MHMRIKTIVLPALFAIVSACGGGGGGDGGGNPDGDIPPGESGLTMKGVAAEPGAKIVATIGDTVLESEVASDGSYEILIPGDTSNAMVELVVSGEEGRSHVVLKSYAGDLDGLRDAAGSDRLVEPADNPRLVVNEVSTAVTAVIGSRLSGEKAVDANVLARAERDLLDGQWVLYGAAAVRRAMATPGLLGNAADTYDVIHDYVRVKAIAQKSDESAAEKTTAAAQHKDEHEDAGLNSGVASFFNLAGDILDDPEQIIPFVADELPAEYLLGSINRSFEINAGKILRFNVDGTGSIAHAVGTEPITWEINDLGYLVIVPENGLQETVEGGAFPRVDSRVTALSYVMINRGEFADTLVERAVYEQKRFTSTGELAATNTREILQAYTAVRPTGRLEWTTDDVTGTWAMPGANRRARPNVDAHVAQDAMMLFNADGTGSLENGADPFNWEINAAGELVVTFADGLVNTYIKLREAAPEVDVLAIAANAVTGSPAQFVNGGLAVKMDVELELNEAALHKRFLMFGDTQLFNLDSNVNFENPLVYEVYESGPMTIFTRDIDGNHLDPALEFGQFRWQFVDNELFAQRLYDVSEQAENWTCQGGLGTCNPRADIRWKILRVTNDRMYVLETTRYYDYLGGVSHEPTTRYTQSLVKWWQMSDHVSAD